MAHSHLRSQSANGACWSDFHDILVEPPASLLLEMHITLCVFVSLATSPSCVIGKVKNEKGIAILAGIEYPMLHCEYIFQVFFCS